MDSKSKLPKPKLRTPISPILQASRIASLRPNLRRSTSLFDMRPPAINKVLKKKVPTTQVKPPSSAIKNILQPSASASKAIKRPAPSTTKKADTGTKPKVAKKIPDWDYKSRYQNLLEKHTSLSEEHTRVKQQVSGFDELQKKYTSLLENHNTLTKQYQELIQNNETQRTELEKLKGIEAQFSELQQLFEAKSLEHSDLQILVKTMEDEMTENKEAIKQALTENQRLNSELTKTIADNNEYLVERRNLHNTVQDLKGNIRVFCRVRPKIASLEDDKTLCLINYPDEGTIELKLQRESVNKITGKTSDNKQSFNFDYIFQQETTQEEFFTEISQLVQSAIDGYNVCVFAYGQTGSGKTYTMQGGTTPQHVGLIPRTVHTIFKKIESLRRAGWVYEVRASFLEIYNENVRDLLDRTGNNLEICHNEGKGTTVKSLRIEPITCYEDFDSFLKTAINNRMVASTDFNEHSSRSHSITKIYLSGKSQTNNVCFTGSLNLVDLAGSESAKTSHSERLAETKSINRSLSTLGTVMLALYNKDKHIPFRNSKLTYLLQSSLGGNSKTLMIVNISPFEENYLESLNSLRFASTVKLVKTVVKKNKGAIPLTERNPVLAD